MNSLLSVISACFPDRYNQLHPSLFLLQREVVCCTTIYLSPLPTDQLESFIENAAPLRSYRLQAAYDFLWWIPLTIYLFAREMAERKIFIINILHQPKPGFAQQITASA